MLVRKDYAKYFERKQKWKKSLENTEKMIHKHLFILTLIIASIILFVH